MPETKAYLQGRAAFKFADGHAMEFEGYGAFFGNVDSHGDIIQPGAFEKAVDDANSGLKWPAMLAQHGLDSLDPIGVWVSMEEDDKGLKMSGRLADTSRARDLYALMKTEPRPAIQGLSIGYWPVEWEKAKDGAGYRRILKKVDLEEVSIVTIPSNSMARVTQVKQRPDTIREFETFLRDAGGFSRSEAKQIAGHGFKAALRDEGEADAAIMAAIDRAKQALRSQKLKSQEN